MSDKNRENVLRAVKAAKIDDPASLADAVLELMRFYGVQHPDDHACFVVLERFQGELRNLGREQSPDWLRKSTKRKPEAHVYAIAMAAAAAFALKKYCKKNNAFKNAKDILKDAGVLTEASLENWANNNRKKNQRANQAYEYQLAQLCDEPSGFLPIRAAALDKTEIKRRAEIVLESIRQGYFVVHHFE